VSARPPLRLPPRRLATAALAVSLAACARAPEPNAVRTPQPRSEANPEFVRRPSWATGLRWSEPRLATAVATETIGPEGGRIALAQTGLVLTVPAGALEEPTEITVRAFPGSVVAYGLEPHGAALLKPAVIEQSLRATAAADERAPTFEGAAFGDPSQLDAEGGVVNADEFRPAQLVAGGSRVRFEVAQLAGYALATGRR